MSAGDCVQSLATSEVDMLDVYDAIGLRLSSCKRSTWVATRRKSWMSTMSRFGLPRLHCRPSQVLCLLCRCALLGTKTNPPNQSNPHAPVKIVDAAFPIKKRSAHAVEVLPVFSDLSYSTGFRPLTHSYATEIPHMSFFSLGV